VTDAKKVKKLAELIEMLSLGRDDQSYPDVVSVIAGHLVIAGLDPGKEYAAPTLTSYSPETAAAWYDAAAEYKRRHRGGWDEALLETEPERP
jgi:hypothetical protein